jgi:hypothetical protein
MVDAKGYATLRTGADYGMSISSCVASDRRGREARVGAAMLGFLGGSHGERTDSPENEHTVKLLKCQV